MGVTTYFSQGEYHPDAEQALFLQKRGVTIEDAPIVEVLGDGIEISAVKLADGRVLNMQGLYVGPKTLMASAIASQLGCEFTEGPLGGTTSNKPRLQAFLLPVILPTQCKMLPLRQPLALWRVLVYTNN